MALVKVASFAALAADQQAYPASVQPNILNQRLVGVVLQETGGAAAEFKVYNGTSTAGALLLHVKLAAGGAFQLLFAAPELCPPTANGLFINRIAGAASISVFFLER
jgi:hypothetical protein